MTREIQGRDGSVFGGTLIASHLTDRRLEIGVSVNGEPPLRQAGDTVLHLVRLRCAGCAIVGEVRANLPRGCGREQVMFTETQIITDETSDPVKVQVIRNVLTDHAGEPITADCPAHGVVEFDAATALRRARKVVEDLFGDGQKRPLKPLVLHERPVGYRRPTRCTEPGCCSMPLDELADWLGGDERMREAFRRASENAGESESGHA